MFKTKIKNIQKSKKARDFITYRLLFYYHARRFTIVDTADEVARVAPRLSNYLRILINPRDITLL